MLILSADVVVDFLPKIKQNQDKNKNEKRIRNKNILATSRCF